MYEAKSQKQEHEPGLCIDNTEIARQGDVLAVQASLSVYTGLGTDSTVANSHSIAMYWQYI
jgi:hypothetical protein